MSGKKILYGATLIDGNGGDIIEKSCVIVDGKNIAFVGKAEDVDLAAQDGEVVDLTGKFMMPGMIDCHVHYGGTDSPRDKDWVMEPDTLQAMISVEEAQLSLAHGFTTVRDISGNGLHLRNMINAGIIEGPRIKACGKGFSRTGGHADAWEVPEEKAKVSHPWGIVCDGEDEIRQGARELIKSGVDWIKVWASGGGLWEKERETDQHYSLEELKVMVEEGKYAGIPVCAHCESLESAKAAIKAGVASIEHGEDLDAECLELMKANDVTMVPTFGLFVEWFSEYVPPERPEHEWLPGDTLGEKEVNRIALNFRTAAEAGIRIAVGADSFCGSLTPYGAYTHKEVHALVDGGMSTMQAIVAATKSGAELLRIDDITGTIEEGKLADLLILDADPVAEIRNICLDNIYQVIKEGRVVSK